MIAELIVLVVILTTVGFIYLTGTVIKSFMLFICTLLSSAVALSFFETAGRLVLGYGYLGQWGFAAVFSLIFIFAFLFLFAFADKLIPTDISFGELPDRIARSVIAVFAGLVFAGVILIAINLMPLSEKWPYERFSIENKNVRPDEPDKTLILNADGFVAGFNSLLSRGSLRTKNSLSVFHPDLLNELSLNRIVSDETDGILAGAETIDVTKAYWPAAPLTTSENQPVNISGKKTVIIQASIKNLPVKDGGALYKIDSGTVTFTMAQVRLIYKPQGTEDNLTGAGSVVYPIGFLKNETTVDKKSMTEEVKFTSGEFPSGKKEIDFVFNIPTDSVPVMLQFKINAAAKVGRVKKVEETQTPPAAP